jgi:transcriptional regulator with XRE-family HTH domain
MNGQIQPDNAALVAKIARLVEERGWNQEDLVRQTSLNRQTVRAIMQRNGQRRLRNVTVSRIAKALGLSVDELRNAPLDRLLVRMRPRPAATGDAALRQLYDQAAQPELLGWLERNPGRAQALSPEEIDELLSLQGTGGPLTRAGVEHFVALLERKRRLLRQVHAVAGTEYLDLLEQLVGLLYEKVQPYASNS